MIAASEWAFGLGAVVLKTSLVLATGAIAVRLLHGASAVARHLVWLTVILGALVVPLLDRWVPMRLPVLPPIVKSTKTVSAPASAAPAQTTFAPTVAQARPSVLPRSRASNVDPGRVLLALWASVSVLLLVRLMVGIAAVRRFVRRARAADSALWQQALADAAGRLGLLQLPRLVMSDEVEMAFTFDSLSPVIVLPAAAEEWALDRRRAVLMHELAHIRRRDLVAHGAAAISCVVYWFNPLIWLAARGLRVESELASDEIVVRAGIRPSEYAQHLLDLVTSFGRRAPSVALAMARPKELEGRLVAILDPRHGRPVSALSQRGTIVALCSAVAVCIGAAAPARRGASAVSPNHVTVTYAGRSRAMDTVAPQHMTRPVRDGGVHALVPVTTPVSRLTPYSIASLRRFGASSVVNPMLMMLRDADSLGLTGAQADSIATLNRRYMVRLSEIWTPVTAYYSAHADEGDDGSLANPVPDAADQTTRALDELLPGLTGLLTPEQRRRVPREIAAYLDAAIVAGLPSSPTGVFTPANQLPGLRGRGRGGG